MELKLTFDDVGLAPVYNNVDSRADTDISTTISSSGLKIDVPILASNMESVIGPVLASGMEKAGSVPIFSRFMTVENKMSAVEAFPNCFMSVGVNDEKELKYLVDAGLKGVCFDIAQGHDSRMLDQVEKARVLGLDVMAGTINSPEAYTDLVNAGANSIRVGVGSGSACLTRIQTGFGVPQLQTLLDIQPLVMRYKVPMISDGGIRIPADAVKAIAAGASAVMCGRLFAQTYESAGRRKEEKGRLYCLYRGQASESLQKAFYGEVKEGSTAEGACEWIEVREKLSDLLKRFCGGIRSGLTYGGSRTIEEFQRKVREFDLMFRVTPNYLIESNIRLDNRYY